MSGPRSLRAAIDAMCKRCIYDPGAHGNWREQVSECSSTGCPLHPLRPISGAFKRQRGGKAVPIGGATGSRVHGPKSGLPAPSFSASEGGTA